MRNANLSIKDIKRSTINKHESLYILISIWVGFVWLSTTEHVSYIVSKYLPSNFTLNKFAISCNLLNTFYITARELNYLKLQQHIGNKQKAIKSSHAQERIFIFKYSLHTVVNNIMIVRYK